MKKERESYDRHRRGPDFHGHCRRIGYGKKIILGDKKIENANAVAKIMNDAGYDVVPFEMDLSSRE